MSPTTRCLFAVLALALLTVVAAGCRSPSASAPSSSGTPPSGTPPTGAAPDFSLVSLDGEAYSLADLKGKPIVLNFWSSGCPHCATVAPYLQDFYTQHGDLGLVVLGVAGPDSETALRDKASSLKLTYPIAISPDTARAYNVSPVPMTYFIDREGNIAASILGAQPRRQFEDAVQK
ncbi:MAG: TlpA family protein disulfide reductase, partial [Armatimonadetes bacterium]|nr:TlpA family protein disulfide reductase [Armatimonadota bacterium]